MDFPYLRITRLANGYTFTGLAKISFGSPQNRTFREKLDDRLNLTFITLY